MSTDRPALSGQDADQSPTGNAGNNSAQRGHRNSFVLSPTPWAGGASDVGSHRTPNQDALAVAAGLDVDGRPLAVAAVSDGVSTSIGSEHASVIAVQTACRNLIDILEALPEPEPAALASAMVDAFALANEHIVAQADTDIPGAWSCTLTVALVHKGTILVGNVGDCRSYWIPDAGEPLLLSVDDSMAQVRIDLGVSREVAESGAAAHAITKWLGPNAWSTTPTLSQITPRGKGWLCVCSDGLWNYASAPELLADTLRMAIGALDADPAVDNPAQAWQVCAEMVAWANAQGGRDNITVGLVRHDP